MDFDDLPDEFPEPPAAIVATHVEMVSQKSLREQRLDRIRDIEDDLFIGSIEVVHNTIKFSEIDEDAETWPPEWEAELGAKGAAKRFREAKAGWRNTKEVPYGAVAAMNMSKAIAKARAVEKQAPRTLAIMFLPSPEAPRPIFEVRDVESE